MENYQKQSSMTARKVDEKKRTIVWRGMTGDIDRDGEVVDPMGMDLKHFRKNPVITFGHDYHSFPVARAIRVIPSEKAIDFVLQFPTEDEAGVAFAKSDAVFRMAKTGFLNAASIGFRAFEDGVEFDREADGVKKPKRVFKATELLELSIVPVPSNPHALNTGFAKGWLRDEDRPFIEQWLRDATEEGPIDWADPVEKVLDGWEDLSMANEHKSRLDAIEEKLDTLLKISKADPPAAPPPGSQPTEGSEGEDEIPTGELNVADWMAAAITAAHEKG